MSKMALTGHNHYHSVFFRSGQDAGVFFGTARMDNGNRAFFSHYFQGV